MYSINISKKTRFESHMSTAQRNCKSEEKHDAVIRKILLKPTFENAAIALKRTGITNSAGN